MSDVPPDAARLAEAVRDACVQAALYAFEDASMSGLCCTGAWECAVGAMRTLDLEAAVQRRSDSETNDPETSDEDARPQA
jgi:hypothetical protein